MDFFEAYDIQLINLRLVLLNPLFCEVLFSVSQVQSLYSCLLSLSLYCVVACEDFNTLQVSPY